MPVATVRSRRRRLLFTFKDVARLLGIAIWRAKELYRSGAIKAVRTAGTEANPRGVRFTRQAIRDYVRSLPEYTPPTVRRKAGAA